MRWTKREKMAVSGTLTVCAAVLAAAGRTPSCLLAAAAMGLSTLGDALLAGIPARLFGSGSRLVKGGAAFLAAHILYLWALFLACGQEGRTLLPGFLLPAALFFVLTALLGTAVLRHARSRVPRLFSAAAFLYLFTVGVHAAAAVTAAGRWGGGFFLNAAGAVLFYVSDAIVLARRYGFARGKHAEKWIWATYLLAQGSLLAGFFLAARLPV